MGNNNKGVERDGNRRGDFYNRRSKAVMNIMMYYSKVVEAKYSLVLGEYLLVLACRLACGVLATHGTLSPLLTDGLLQQEEDSQGGRHLLLLLLPYLNSSSSH
jgi:hypothetical protein